MKREYDFANARRNSYAVRPALLEEWAKWAAGRVAPPFVLPADRDFIHEVLAKKTTNADPFTWQEVQKQEWFCDWQHDNHVHTGLLPHPFCGDLMRARVYFLLLNPGLNPVDYFAEYEVPAFRKAVLRNLRQEFSGCAYPFMFLDPQFSWHSGFDWWQTKLSGVIRGLTQKQGISFADARRLVAGRVASIELCPYHSRSSRAVSRLTREGRMIPSAELVRQFVIDYVRPRVEKDDVIVVVMRKKKTWGLSPCRNVVCFSGIEARGAHLDGKVVIGIVQRLTSDDC